MKKINIIFTAGIALLVGASSCKKIDELHPYDQITVSTGFQTVRDAKAWDLGFYDKLRSLQYGDFSMATDIQSDELNATLDWGNNYGGVHRWGTSFQSSDYTLQNLWQSPYNGIADVNIAIAGFATIKPAASEVAQMNQYTGDAYLFRAYLYNMLILRFAKAYNSATAATDPGVPLLLKYDRDALPARASVQAVYTQILTDIAQAKTLLANIAGVQGSTTFTIDAATALEARVKLEMKDYAGAYTAAQSLISANKYPLITTLSAFQNYWTNDGTQESIMQSYVSTTQTPNANTLYINYLTSTKANDPYFVPTQAIVDLYDNADIRKSTYFINTSALIGATKVNSIYLVNKFPGNPALWTGATSNYQNAPKVFRIAEMYCIAAEAAAMSGNDANALAAVNALRAARGVTPFALAGTALQTAIMQERTRELAFEGFRIDDLKRWHQGFNGRPAQNTTIINTGSSFNTISVSADDPKFVWGIPTNDVTVNPNIKQNPGW